MNASTTHRILKATVSVSLLLGSLSGPATGQVDPQTKTGELYGGIEISAEGVKAIALRVSQSEEAPGLKLVYSENINLSLGRTNNGKNTSQTAEKVARAVQKLQTQLRQQHQVLSERIYLIGSSELEADLREELANGIKKMTGKSITFLDPETEIQLNIVGTIPQRERVGSTSIDNRNSSVLIEVGNHSTRGGYQLLRYTPSAQYDFVTMNISQGTMSFSNEVSKALGEEGDWTTIIQQAKTLGSSSLREALQRERESKPGLVNRKRIYLTGGIAWALATLLYPQDRQSFVPISPKDIAMFAGRAARNPQSLLKPDLSRMTDRTLRQEIEADLEMVRNTFSPQQLIAGAELLRIAAVELNWQEKKIWFARFGNYGCILSYVRLQAEK